MESDRVQREKVRERAVERIPRRPQQMDEMRGLVDGEQIDPVRELADLRLRLGRLGVENDPRRVEQSDRDAVRVGNRILDHDVGDGLRREAHFRDDRGAHRLQPRRRARGPRFVRGGIVHAKVRRGDGPPILMRRLRGQGGR